MLWDCTKIRHTLQFLQKSGSKNVYFTWGGTRDSELAKQSTNPEMFRSNEPSKEFSAVRFSISEIKLCAFPNLLNIVSLLSARGRGREVRSYHKAEYNSRPQTFEACTLIIRTETVEGDRH
jgi:hypothetical protein